MTERSHLVNSPGDNRAICGVKDPSPATWAATLRRFPDHRGVSQFEPCTACYTGAGIPVPEAVGQRSIFDELEAS